MRLMFESRTASIQSLILCFTAWNIW